MDPGKTSKRRAGKGYAEGHVRLFGDKKVTPGRRVYRQTPNGMVEIENPSPLRSSDLRFEGTFQSPVDGSRISNRNVLDDHNKRHGVTQILPGMEQDQESQRKDMHDKAFGKQAKEERTKDIVRAIEQGEQNA